MDIQISHPTQPEAKVLTMNDVWGHHDEKTYEMIDYGMVVARGCGKPEGDIFTQEEYEKITKKIPDVCPVWNEELEYKSVTVICDKDKESEVTYWLEYVHGGNCVSKTKQLSNGKIAIRSNYQCW